MSQFQYWVKTSSCKNIMRQLTPRGAWRNRKKDLCEAGLGGTIIQDIIKAFTRRSV